MDGGAWWAAVHGVAKSRTRLSEFTFTFHFHALVENPSANAGDTGSIPDLRRSPGEGNGTLSSILV